MVAYNIIYTPLGRMAFTIILHWSAIHVCSSKICFQTYKSSLIDLGEKPAGDIMMPSLASEAQVI